MISSDDASGNLLNSWRNAGTSLRIIGNVGAEGTSGPLTFIGPGIISDFDSGAMTLQVNALFMLNFNLSQNVTESSVSFPHDKPNMAVVTIKCGVVNVALMGPSQR